VSLCVCLCFKSGKDETLDLVLCTIRDKPSHIFCHILVEYSNRLPIKKSLDFVLLGVCSEPRSHYTTVSIHTTDDTMDAIVPSATIYIKNLNDQLKTEALKKQLHMLFSQYGRITQIVACKGPKLRGQVRQHSI
jgi:hypothetical protein